MNADENVYFCCYLFIDIGASENIKKKFFRYNYNYGINNSTCTYVHYASRTCIMVALREGPAIESNARLLELPDGRLQVSLGGQLQQQSYQLEHHSNEWENVWVIEMV